jgi:alpha-amylase/alpha-mannosidase (GH57 family)
MILKDRELKKTFCLCMHGHFYQPPRENPSLELIEIQKSAFPFHDWNERITRECYGPNTRGRLHGDRGLISKLINNYSFMSFDFGPTLLSWLEVSHPWIYSQILAADREGQKRYNGHGNAIAQVYNHIIMPLASSRDKLTQIRWGLADFRHRFHREAEGMWLAETAVDTETLELMVDEGIKFTILSPDQASATRTLENKYGAYSDNNLKDAGSQGEWIDVKGGRIDPTRPYRIFLSAGTDKFIDVFFYDGPLSRSIAYEKTLSSGEELMGRIKKILDSHKDGPRILSVATDGESYGHHFKFGEMALSWLFDKIENESDISLTNFGSFLELFPPQQEVKIIENSSWSCAHGVERWRSDCGCNVGGKREWNQKWRTPLRNGLEWLSGELSSIFENRAGRLLKNPWDARNDYISALLDESDTDAYLNRHSIRALREDEKIEVLCLMESQRMALYMFTSCGWFFDDISGIESIQILMYASRAIDLVRRSSPNDLEKGLIEFLAQAESNDPSYKNGASLYETMVKPSKITSSLAAAHYAIIALLENVDPVVNLFVKTTRRLRQNQYEKNGIKALLGEVIVTEKRTGKEVKKRFLAVREKGPGFSCVTGSVSTPDYELLNEEISRSFSDSPESLVTVFSMMSQEVQYFELGDLIPDVRLGVFNALGNSLENRIKHSIGSSKGLIEEFLNVLYLIKEPSPSFLHSLFSLLFAESYSDLLDGTHDEEQLDFSQFLKLLDHFHPDSSQVMENKKMPLCIKELTTEPLFKKEAQAFILRSLKIFADSKKPVVIRNIINFLKFIILEGIELDLWESQNIFYDTCLVSGFIKNDNPRRLPMLMELGLLLGFIIKE